MPKIAIRLAQGRDLADVPIAVSVVDTDLETRWKDVITLGGSKTTGTLKAGRYSVQASLPSGQVLTRVCDLTGRKNQTVELDLVHGSPYESLEWAQISTTLTLEQARQRETQLRSVWLRLWRCAPGGRWTLLPWPVQTPLREPGLVQYTFNFFSEERFGLYYLQVGGPTMQWRLFALPADDLRVLVTGADMVGQHDPSDSAVDVAVTSKNHGAEALLGYLMRGEVNQALLVGQSAFVQDLLSGKRSNPAAAAVAGYFLLASGDTKSLSQIWSSTLADWTPWLVDGSVIDAWSQLQPPSPDVARARRRLLEAAARGMPVYTRGLRLLFDGLSILDGDPSYGGPDIRAALNLVRPYAAAADWRSPITSFIGLDPGTPGPTPLGMPADPTHVVFLANVGPAELAWKRSYRTPNLTMESAPFGALGAAPPEPEEQARQVALGQTEEAPNTGRGPSHSSLERHTPDEESKRRYRERQGQREAPPASAPSANERASPQPEQFVARLLRARSTQTQGEQISGATPITLIPDTEHPPQLRGLALERILGLSDLFSISFLGRGLTTGGTIGRVVANDKQGGLARYATGLLVSPRLVLTNHHVVPSATEAALSGIEFEFQDGPDGRLLAATYLRFEPEQFFLTDARLDVSLIAVHPPPALAALGWTQLVEERGKAVVGERLSIIHHPDGAPKQVGIRTNRLADILEDFLHYEGSTAVPSSGAPLFNDQWEVIGLHHASIPDRDADGQILARDGTVWNSDGDGQPIQWVAFEATRISSIVAFLKRAELTEAQASLRDELLHLKPPLIVWQTGPEPECTPPVAEAAPASVNAPGPAPLPLQEAFDRLNVSLDLIPPGSSNRPRHLLQPTHITIHNTANASPDADALMHARYLKGAEARARQVSWHFTVDDKRCVKHLPTIEVGWHAGQGNTVSIGIEICEHQGIDQARANERAALLTAVLLFQLNLPPEHVVPHRFWTGKHCPHTMLDEAGGFERFHAQVRQFLAQLRTPPAAVPGGAAAPPPSEERAAPLLADQAAGGHDEVAREAPASDEERVAALERLVGRLTLENEALRRELRDLQNRLYEAE